MTRSLYEAIGANSLWTLSDIKEKNARMQRQLTMLALHFAATLRRCFERAHLVVTLAVWMHWALNCMASAYTLLIHHICQTDEVCNARREPRLRLIAEMISNSDRHCDGKSRTKNTTMRNSRVNIENLCTVISVGDQLYGGFITPTQRASPTGHWPFNREIGSIGWLFPLHVAAVTLLGTSRLSANQLQQASKAKYVTLMQD